MNPFRSIHNNRGLGLLSLLLLMPMLLLLISHFFHRWSELKDSKELRAVCRNELGRGLAHAGNQIQQLLDLNPMVRSLKIQMRLAQASLVAATIAQNPPGMAAARARIKAIQLAQNQLVQKQQLHIFKAKFALQAANVATKARLLKLKSPSRISTRQILGIQGRVPEPAVRKQNPADTHPEYELLPQFEQRQKMELSWHSNFRVERKESTWSQHQSQIPESCGMSLRKKFRGFETYPLQDKFFWRL